MIILTGDRKQVINSDFVERFCLVERTDATLIIASYSDTRNPVTLTKYQSFSEARDALEDLFSALIREDSGYVFPLSKMFNEGFIKRDARTKRHGGS